MFKRGTDFNGNSAEGYFRSIGENLGQSSVRGGTSLLISEVGCNIFRLLGMVILARLLMPEHFGLIAMVTAISGAVELFKDLGLATVTVKEKDITHDQISTLFWVNTGIGVALTVLFAGLGPIISWFYNDTRLFWIVLAISPAFLMGGITVQHQALLRRNMKFTQLAAIQLIATGLSIVVSVVLAWEGFGYWSLVWREIVRPMISWLGVWWHCRWLPGAPKFGPDIRRLFQSGSQVTGFNVLVFGARSLDQILLGKFWGAVPVGLYKQAGTVLQLQSSMVTFPITNVMTSALSALQGEPEKYSKYYKEAVSLLAFCQMPLAAFFVVFSESIVMVLFGQKWVSAAPLLQILAMASAFESVASTTGVVMVTSHKTREYLNLGAVNATSIIAGILAGVKWGAVGVATALVVVSYLSFPLIVWYSLKGTFVSPRQLYTAISLPFCASILLGMCLLAIQHLAGSGAGLGELAYSSILAPILYCSIWLLFPGGRQKLRHYFLQVLKAAGDVISRVRPAFSPMREA